MQLKRQSVEAWQNVRHYSEENNTNKNPIPIREIWGCPVKPLSQ